MRSNMSYMDSPLNGKRLTDRVAVGEAPAAVYPASKVGSAVARIGDRMSKILMVAVICVATAGCVKPVAEQCLDSFRSSLKDPQSGKVIGLTHNILIYTATNSYGARIQGKALCMQDGDQWRRDQTGEHLMVLERTRKVLREFNECRRGGGSQESCAGSNISLRFVGADGVNVDELTKESARAIGFD